MGTVNFALLIKAHWEIVGRYTMLSHHDDENFVLGFMGCWFGIDTKLGWQRGE